MICSHHEKITNNEHVSQDLETYFMKITHIPSCCKFFNVLSVPVGGTLNLSVLKYMLFYSTNTHQFVFIRNSLGYIIDSRELLTQTSEWIVFFQVSYKETYLLKNETNKSFFSADVSSIEFKHGGVRGSKHTRSSLRRLTSTGSQKGDEKAIAEEDEVSTVTFSTFIALSKLTDMVVSSCLNVSISPSKHLLLATSTSMELNPVSKSRLHF